MARVINKNQEIDVMQGGLQKQNYYNRLVWSESENNLKMGDQKQIPQNHHHQQDQQNLQQKQFENKQSRREYNSRPKIAISNKLPAEFSQNQRNNSVSASNSKDPQSRIGSSDKGGRLQQNRIYVKNSGLPEQYSQSFQSDSFQIQPSKANEKNYRILSQFPEINGMNQHQYLKQVESSQSYYVQAQPSGIEQRGKVRKNPLNQSEGSSSKDHLINNYNQKKQDSIELSYENSQHFHSPSSPIQDQMASSPSQNMNSSKYSQGQKNQLRQLVKYMHDQEQQKNSNLQQLQQKNQNNQMQQYNQQQSVDEVNQFDSLQQQQIYKKFNNILTNQEMSVKDSKRQLDYLKYEEQSKTKSHLKTNNLGNMLHHSNSQPADISQNTSKNKQIQQNQNSKTHYFNNQKIQSQNNIIQGQEKQQQNNDDNLNIKKNDIGNEQSQFQKLLKEGKQNIQQQTDSINGNIKSPNHSKPVISQQYYVMKYASPNQDLQEFFKNNSVSDKSNSVQSEQKESQLAFQKKQKNQESTQQVNDTSYNQYFMKQTASSNLTQTKRKSSRIICQQQNETQISSNTSSNSLSNQTGQQYIQKDSLQISQNEQTISSPLQPQSQSKQQFNLLKDIPSNQLSSKNTETEFQPPSSGNLTSRRNTQTEEKTELIFPKDSQQQMKLRKSFEIQDIQQQRYFIKMQKKQNQFPNKNEINSPLTPQIIGQDQSQQIFFNKPVSSNSKLNILCSPQKSNTSLQGLMANTNNNSNKLISIAKVLNSDNFNAQSTGALQSSDSLNKGQMQSPTYKHIPSRPQTTRDIKDNLVNIQNQIQTPQVEQNKINDANQVQEKAFIKPQLTEQEILKLFSQNDKKQDSYINSQQQKNKSSSDRIYHGKGNNNTEKISSQNNAEAQLKINIFNNETDIIEGDNKKQSKPQKLTFVKGISFQQLKELSQQNTPKSNSNDDGENFTYKMQQLEGQNDSKSQGLNVIEQAIQNTDLLIKPPVLSSQSTQDQISAKSKFCQLREDSRLQAFKQKIDQIQPYTPNQANISSGELSPVESIMKLKNKHSKKLVIQQVYSNNRNSQSQQQKSILTTNNISSNFQSFKYDIVQRQLQQIQKNSDENTPQGRSENQNYFFHSRFQDQPSVMIQSNDVNSVNFENIHQIKKPRSDIIAQQPSVNSERFKSLNQINNSGSKVAKYESERNSLADIMSNQNIQERTPKEIDEIAYQSNYQSNDSSNQSFQNKILQRRAFSSHNNFSAQESKQSSFHKKTSLDNSFSQIDNSANKMGNKKTKNVIINSKDILTSNVNEKIEQTEDPKVNAKPQGNSNSSRSTSYFVQVNQKSLNQNVNKQFDALQKMKLEDDSQSDSIQDKLPQIKSSKNTSSNLTPTQYNANSNKSLNQGFQNFANYLNNFEQVLKDKCNPEQKFEEKQLSFRKSVQQLNNNIKIKWSHIRNKLIQDKEDDITETINKSSNKEVKSSTNLNENQTNSENDTPKSPNKLNQILNQNSQNQQENSQQFQSPTKKLQRGNSFQIMKQAYTPQQSSRQKDNFENFITKTGLKNNSSNNSSPININSFFKQSEGRNRFQIKMNQLENDNSKLSTNFILNQQKNQALLTSSNTNLKQKQQPNSARDFEREVNSPSITNMRIKINELITVKQISPNIRKVVHVPTLKVFILRSIEINSSNRSTITIKIANSKTLSEKYPFIINPIIQVFYNTPENHISILSEYQPLKSLKKVINCFSTINERSLQQIVIQLITKLSYIEEQDLQDIYVSLDNILFDKSIDIKLDCSSREKQSSQKDELLKVLKKHVKSNNTEETQYETKRSNSSKQSSQATSTSFNNNQRENKNEKKPGYTLPVQLGLLLIEAALGDDIIFDYSSFQFSSFVAQDQLKDCENCCFLHKIFNNKIILYSDQQSNMIKRLLQHQYTTNFIDFICQCLQNESLQKLSSHLFVQEITNQKFNSINELIPISIKFESEQEEDSQKKLDQILSSLSNSIPNFSSSLKTMKITKSSLKEDHPFVDMLQKDLGLAAWNILGQLQKAYDIQLAY